MTDKELAILKERNAKTRKAQKRVEKPKEHKLNRSFTDTRNEVPVEVE
jgi:hypothetical protein